MFARRYYPGRYFAPRYFPAIGAELPPPAAEESVVRLGNLSIQWDDRGKTAKERRKRKKERAIFRQELERAYARVVEGVDEAAAVAAIVKPFAVSHDTALPPADAIDWKALTADIAVVKALAEIIPQIQAATDRRRRYAAMVAAILLTE